MCNFGSRVVWRNGRRSISSYLDDDTIKYQERIAGCILEDDVGDRFLKRIPQINLILIDDSISSCCSILNSTERIYMITQANTLASVLCDIESDGLG